MITSNLDLSSLQVLLVEDEAVTRTAVMVLLEQLGAKVFAVGAVRAAIEAIESGLQPDLVLCNLRLPDGYGTEVLKALQQQDQKLGRKTPAIVLSGETHAGLESDFSNLYRYIPKPFNSNVLINTIQQLLASQAE